MEYEPAEIPQTQSVIPGTRECKLAIRWQDHIGHKVTMTVKWLLRHTVTGLIASQSPNNQWLVYSASNNQWLYSYSIFIATFIWLT